jgi:hypothetical protein
MDILLNQHEEKETEEDILKKKKGNEKKDKEEKDKNENQIHRIKHLFLLLQDK